MKLSIKIILLLLGVNFLGYAQLIKVEKPNTYFQADIFIDNENERYSTLLNIKFNNKVIELAKGEKEATINHVVKSSVSNLFMQIENEYGSFKLEKVHPDIEWGDTRRKNKRNGRWVTVPDLSQKFRIIFGKIVPIDKIISLLKSNPNIEYVEGPAEIVPTYSPNDYYFVNGPQWNLNNIEAEKAWDITKGSSSILISINDFYGMPDVTRFHDELTGKFAYHYSTTAFGNHGTIVAGVAGALTNNSIGVASLGYETRLMGHQWGIESQIRRAADDGADIINFSWITTSSVYRDDVLYALRLGVVCVAAAGNDSSNLGTNPPVLRYPAGYYFAPDTQVIAVSGTYMIGGNELFVPDWNYSPGTDPISDPTNSFIDISAPGGSIITVHDSLLSDYLMDVNGTSLSAPQVSALTALILSINDTLSPSHIYSILTNSAEKIGQFTYDGNGWNRYMGYGRINAYEALKYTIENYGGTFDQDVIIPSGDSWTIEPGVTLSFENGSSLVVNGHLQINGTSGSNVVFDFGSPNSTTQNGIKINPGATMVATYTDMQNAYRGIYFNESYGTVNNCTFEDCEYGLYLYRTNYAAQQPNFNYNTVFKNTYDANGVGVYCSYSSPYMTNNEVYNYYTGIGVIYNSSPQLGYSSAQGRNNLHNNYKNLHAISSSNPFLGSTGFGSYSGYNKFTNASYLNILAQTNCNILAEINWWGSSDQQTIESTISTSSSTVDFIPFLNSSPFRAVIDPGLTQALNKITDENNELFKAQEFIIGKEYEKSLQIINKYKNSIDLNDALFTFDLILQLKRAMQEDGLSFDEEHHLNSIKELNRNKIVAGMIDLYRSCKVKKNFTSIEEIKNNYKQESEVVTAALFTEFMIHFNELNDYESARNKLVTAYQKNSEHPLVEAATKLLSDVYPEIRIELPKSSPANSEKTSQVTEFTLLTNYPNPRLRYS